MGSTRKLPIRASRRTNSERRRHLIGRNRINPISVRTSSRTKINPNHYRNHHLQGKRLSGRLHYQLSLRKRRRRRKRSRRSRTVHSVPIIRPCQVIVRTIRLTTHSTKRQDFCCSLPSPLPGIRKRLHLTASEKLTPMKRLPEIHQ